MITLFFLIMAFAFLFVLFDDDNNNRPGFT